MNNSFTLARREVHVQLISAAKRERGERRRNGEMRRVTGRPLAGGREKPRCRGGGGESCGRAEGTPQFLIFCRHRRFNANSFGWHGSLARQACKAVCLLTRGSSEKVKIKFLFSFCEWLLRFPSVGRCPQFLCGGGSRQISGLNEELEMKEMRKRQTERHSSSNGNGMERSLSGPCLFSISMQQQQSAEMEGRGKCGRTRRTMFRGSSAMTGRRSWVCHQSNSILSAGNAIPAGRKIGTQTISNFVALKPIGATRRGANVAARPK